MIRKTLFKLMFVLALVFMPASLTARNFSQEWCEDSHTILLQICDEEFGESGPAHDDCVAEANEWFENCENGCPPH